ncbi:MAG: hypothetical protein K0M56_02290 [Kaistella sp.]|nr:hypothetical protein [Kaistella sp.]
MSIVHEILHAYHYFRWQVQISNEKTIFTNRRNSRPLTMGQKISKAHPNLTVIAFNGFVTYDPTANGMKNVNAGQNKGDGLGEIVFYQNVASLVGYRYNQFLKKYP